MVFIKNLVAINAAKFDSMKVWKFGLFTPQNRRFGTNWLSYWGAISICILLPHFL